LGLLGNLEEHSGSQQESHNQDSKTECGTRGKKHS